MKFKDFCKKLSEVIRVIFGWGIYISLFAGGLTFLGFVAAIIIGGTTGGAISVFIYKEIFPVIIYISTVMVLLGLLSMYLNGEVALTSANKKNKQQ